ncbi:caspase, EACC1-associated type [Nocardia asiatica]|uniref:caspase, EACC1-associated type n=1 Tax=Nocardia asiatica TaxID=209252 RepID=UPI002453B6F4|nr:caspase family protein [Nocardia asiatica]
MRMPDPTRSWAVLLGTSTFADADLPDLPAVRNNIADLAEVLTSPWATALPSERCVALPDEADRAVIGGRLNAVAAQAQDLLLVYYAGHGLIGPDGSLYLSLPNTRSDRDMVSWTALPFELLRRTLASAPADNRVLILDCCFSGLAVDLMTEVAAAVSGQITVAGTCTLTSSPANRPANAPVNARHTAYTGELLTVLQRGPSDPGTEFLTITDLHQHLEKVLLSKGFPRPEQRNTRTIGQLALARRRPVSAPATVQHGHLETEDAGLRSTSAYKDPPLPAPAPPERWPPVAPRNSAPPIRHAHPRVPITALLKGSHPRERGMPTRQAVMDREPGRRKAVVAATVVLVAVVTIVIGAAIYLPGLIRTDADSAARRESQDAATPQPTQIPAGFVPPPVRPTSLPDPVYCRYKPDGNESTVTRPDDGPVPSKGIVRATINTNAGAIPLLLDRSLAPCTVHSFLSLAKQGAFERTRCVGGRTEWIGCGTSRSPGYDLHSESFIELPYRRGYLTMDSLTFFGTTFSIFFADSQLLPEATVFGTVSDRGLQVIDSLIPPDYDGQSDRLNNLLLISIDIED